MPADTDYSFWASLDTWTLKEAVDLLTNHLMSGISGDEDDVYIAKRKARFRVWGRLTANIKVFAVDPGDIKYQNVTAPTTTVGTPFAVAELANELETTVEVHKLLRWASSENIKLPSEFKAVLVNSLVKKKVDEPKPVTQPNNEGSSEEYRFEKINGIWNIAFKDVVLKGIKSVFGLDIIKLLLQNPNKKFNVMRLQQLTGTYNTGTSEEGGYLDAEQDGWLDPPSSHHGVDSNKSQYGTASDTWHSDATAIYDCKRRIQEIDAQLETARGGCVVNRSKIQRLEKEREEIEAYLGEANKKPKDPEWEKHRKKVCKNINEAIAKIGKLESMHGYHDMPISGHLKRHIKKGSSCSYLIEESLLPAWRF